MASSALAADLAVRRAPRPAYVPVVVPLYSWSGCYVGGNGGGIWAKSEWNGTVFGGDSTASGGVGGLQVGCNYQTRVWGVGVPGDYDLGRAETDKTNPVLKTGPKMDHTEIKNPTT